MTNSYGTLGRTYNLGISPEARRILVNFWADVIPESQSRCKRAKALRINLVSSLRVTVEIVEIERRLLLLFLTFAVILLRGYNF